MNTVQIKALILNTITKEYRNKAIMFFMVIIFTVISLANVLMNFVYENFLQSGGGQAVIGDKSLLVLFTIVSFIMTIISTVLGLSCIKSDFESTSINQILSFPIKRIEYVGARIFGSWLIAVFAFVISILFTAFLISSKGSLNLFTPQLFLAIMTASLNMLTIITIAACMSLFIPKIFAFVFTFIFRYLISSSNFAYSMDSFQNAEPYSFSKIFAGFFHFLFPRIQPMDGLTHSLLAGVSFDFSVVALFGHYFVTYIFLFFFLNWLISRRDI